MDENYLLFSYRKNNTNNTNKKQLINISYIYIKETYLHKRNIYT